MCIIDIILLGFVFLVEFESILKVHFASGMKVMLGSKHKILSQKNNNRVP